MLTTNQIESINKKCPYGQGIFIEPFGIPNHIKEYVIYSKWQSEINFPLGAESYLRPNSAFKVLDLTLKELKPDIC